MEHWPEINRVLFSHKAHVAMASECDLLQAAFGIEQLTIAPQGAEGASAAAGGASAAAGGASAAAGTLRLGSNVEDNAFQVIFDYLKNILMITQLKSFDNVQFNKLANLTIENIRAFYTKNGTTFLKRGISEGIDYIDRIVKRYEIPMMSFLCLNKYEKSVEQALRNRFSRKLELKQKFKEVLEYVTIFTVFSINNKALEPEKRQKYINLFNKKLLFFLKPKADVITMFDNAITTFSTKDTSRRYRDWERTYFQEKSIETTRKPRPAKRSPDSFIDTMMKKMQKKLEQSKKEKEKLDRLLNKIFGEATPTLDDWSKFLQLEPKEEYEPDYYGDANIQLKALANSLFKQSLEKVKEFKNSFNDVPFEAIYYMDNNYRKTIDEVISKMEKTNEQLEEYKKLCLAAELKINQSTLQNKLNIKEIGEEVGRASLYLSDKRVILSTSNNATQYTDKLIKIFFNYFRFVNQFTSKNGEVLTPALLDELKSLQKVYQTYQKNFSDLKKERSSPPELDYKYDSGEKLTLSMDTRGDMSRPSTPMRNTEESSASGEDSLTSGNNESEPPDGRGVTVVNPGDGQYSNYGFSPEPTVLSLEGEDEVVFDSSDSAPQEGSSMSENQSGRMEGVTVSPGGERGSVANADPSASPFSAPQEGSSTPGNNGSGATAAEESSESDSAFESADEGQPDKCTIMLRFY